MLQQDRPDDYVIAAGESYSAQEFVATAFAGAGLDWREYVRFDPRYVRPSEVDHLQGDASKVARELGWLPSTSFEQLVRIMLEADIRAEMGEEGVALLLTEEALAS